MTREEVLARFDLSGRVAVVTGGSRGIGRAVAEAFAACGARVVVASRKAEVCDEVVAAIEANGGEALAAPTHVGDLDALAGLVDATVERFGGLDVLVNNAANALALPLGHLTPEAWAKSHDVNLRGPVFLFQLALPHLRASEHASVINLVTAGVFTHGTYLSLYVSAKAALLAMTRAMAAECAGLGVRVNALAPGPVDTDMVRANSDDMQARMRDSTLLRRIASTDEMVGPALFLASDASSFMTGQVLLVDGGLAVH